MEIITVCEHCHREVDEVRENHWCEDMCDRRHGAFYARGHQRSTTRRVRKHALLAVLNA